MVSENQSFFEFEFPQKSDELFIKSVLTYDEQSLKIGKFVPGEIMEFKISEGSNWYDLVRFQDPFNFAISERLYNLLKDNHITGWNGYKISITGTKKTYYGFQVLGRCGPIKRPAQRGFYTGTTFDIDSWDGSDFFCPECTLHVFCTKKVSDLFKINHITNIQLIDITKVESYSIGE